MSVINRHHESIQVEKTAVIQFLGDFSLRVVSDREVFGKFYINLTLYSSHFTFLINTKHYNKTDLWTLYIIHRSMSGQTS